MQHVDLVVIGSGQGGVPLAVDFAKAGKQVVLFERGTWGGSCLNYGCTPSKMFLASAHQAAAARNADRLGVHADVTVDFPAVMSRVRETVLDWTAASHARLTDAGVRAIEAEAAFVGPRQVKGGGVEVEAETVVINTGKSPFVPGIDGEPGLRAAPHLTYKSFWHLARLPAVTLVLGAGFVGLELGQGLARLGSEVHFIERADRPIPRVTPDISEILKDALTADGAIFHLGATAAQVDHNEQTRTFTVHLESGETLEGQALLVSAGRRSNTVALNASAGEVALDDHGNVVVDEHLRTSCEGVYAIGDVTGQPAFTHVSWEDYRRIKAILDGEARTQMDRVLGYALFTEPQVAQAGLTLAQAEDKGYDAREATMPLSDTARASEIGRTRGLYRMVIDRETDAILGATLVGPNTAELIHVFIAHIEAGSTWQRLDQSVHIHPTFAESLPTLARRFAD